MGDVHTNASFLRFFASDLELRSPNEEDEQTDGQKDGRTRPVIRPISLDGGTRIH